MGANCVFGDEADQPRESEDGGDPDAPLQFRDPKLEVASARCRVVAFGGHDKTVCATCKTDLKPRCEFTVH
jgi:hypothetical protein